MDSDIWDEIVNEPLPAGPDTPQVPVPGPATILSDSPTSPLPIEEQPISLPSNGNVPAIYHELELSHRISHADHHLNRIQDLIAEKIFQYSHVICVAPRKAVNTHSRAAVKKLNLEIALHCRLYSQCRTRLLRLGADLATQSQFRVLTPDDVKASMAVVNPNEPGSTQLKLSWIWQTAGGHHLGLVATESQSSADAGADAGPGADVNILECKYRLHFLI